MQKTLLTFLVHLFCATISAQNVPLQELGDPLRYTGFTLAWSAPTSGAPATLSIYRVLPAHFSPSVASNLMALGGFTLKDRTIPVRRPPFNNPDALFFSKPEIKRTLGIYPHGYIEYRAEKVRDYHIDEGVPSESEAIRLGTNYLRQLGVAIGQLATKPNSSELRVASAASKAFYHKPGQSVIHTAPSRSVSFTRRLDGVDFMTSGGAGGCRIDFGHHAAVHTIELLWRNLEREKSFPMPSPEALMKSIREGRCVWNPWEPIDMAWVKKITVTNMVPLYYDGGHDVSQDWVCPFVELYTLVDIAKTNVTLYASDTGLQTNFVSIRTNLAVRVCCPAIGKM